MNSFCGTLRLLCREFAPCPLPRSSHTESCKWQLNVRHIHANQYLSNWNAAGAQTFSHQSPTQSPWVCIDWIGRYLDEARSKVTQSATMPSGPLGRRVISPDEVRLYPHSCVQEA
ncbi:hypothetical protein HBH53_109390 [Parastagonospora nodorum]|nr:hypothetical protein HBH53_109390 [Parastagonospora nodorum]KAH5113933.1 hypothetical protein HBH71_152430 [Parastagonospora nodorum]